jgi:hypothetical protein
MSKMGTLALMPLAGDVFTCGNAAAPLDPECCKVVQDQQLSYFPVHFLLLLCKFQI